MLPRELLKLQVCTSSKSDRTNSQKKTSLRAFQWKNIPPPIGLGHPQVTKKLGEKETSPKPTKGRQGAWLKPAQPPQAEMLLHADGPHQSWHWWHFLGMPYFSVDALWEQGNANVFAPLCWEEAGWGKPLWHRTGKGAGCREEEKGRD